MTEEQFEDQYPESWRPNPGDTIKGEITEIKMAPAMDAKRPAYPIVNVQTADGEKSVHAFHTVLRRELARKKPGLGDPIEITYMGKKESKTGDLEFHNYRVKGGAARAFDWDSQLPEAERQGSYSSGAPPIDPAPTRSEVLTAQELRERQEREANEAMAAAAEENFGDSVPF